MLGVGIGVTHSASSIHTVPAPEIPLCDVDFVGGTFRVLGEIKRSLPEFLQNVQGEANGNALSFGGYVSPTTENLIQNGRFEQGTFGWPPYNGALLNVVNGEAVLSANGGNLPGFHQAIRCQIGKAYRLNAKLRRIDTAAALTVAISLSLTSANSLAHEAHNTTQGTEIVRHFSGNADPIYVAGRQIVNGVQGESAFSNFSLKECLPIIGWVQRRFTLAIEAKVPSTFGASQILFQLDDGGQDTNGAAYNRNYLRILLDSSGALRLIIRHKNIDTSNILIGQMSAGEGFSLVLSQNGNSIYCGILGRSRHQIEDASHIGFAFIRVGRGQVGDLWLGNLERFKISAKPVSVMEFERVTEGPAGIAMWGDSLTAGAGATGGIGGDFTVSKVASGLLGHKRLVHNGGKGGQTSTQIAARMNALPIEVQLENGRLPSKGGVLIISKTINILFNSGAFMGSEVGSIAGVMGVMSTNSNGDWTFTRFFEGPALAVEGNVQFLCNNAEQMSARCAWLWLGRNGAATGRTVEADIAAAVASLSHTRYLIGEILASAHDTASSRLAIAQRNQALSDLYKERFVPFVAPLQSAAVGEEDAQDVLDGLVPRSIRSDAVHLNDAGYAIVAQRFVAKTLSLGF